ncbi:hypothetical protein JN01_0258 [Entomoplasma freundtii]|uniref:Uncharacterized protein n=1 Tax=Entomoplasma freundtii TaxID=74700 RepID=A0A2K8NRP7_9MOLU|nr:lipoprotein [Entomoplasma freundtii]ATZ16532.1 hypothetical protein EFREU_v1c05110 [Entomoplasma freundtii]TDY58302.1 hypothetical protein JN01_0258 [Entomoplasma freundtii]
MRKLLAILGSLSLVATTSSVVVACKKDNEEGDTGSVFIKADGSLNITADGLLKWYQENVGNENGIAQLKAFYQSFAVAILQNAGDKDSVFADIKPSPTMNQYALEDFQQKLKDIWGLKSDQAGSVQGAANNSWKQKEDAAKKSYGDKNYKKKLVDELAKTFPYVDKDFDSLKKAFISNDILTNKSTGAQAQLTKLLANNSSQSFINSGVSTSELLNNFKSLWGATKLNDLATNILAQLNKKNEDEKTENILNLFNATGGTNIIATPGDSVSQKPWKLDSINWATLETTWTKEMVEDLLYRLSTSFDPTSENLTNSIDWAGSKTVSQRWNYVTADGNYLRDTSTYFDLVESFPNFNFSSLKLDTNSKNAAFGMLNNSQRFLVDQFFQNQKPISISQIVFKKSESGDLTKLINGQAFLSSMTSDSKNWEQYYGLYNFLQNYVTGKGTSTNPEPDPKPDSKTFADETGDGINSPIPGIGQYTFDTIFGSNSKSNIGKIKLDGAAVPNKIWWDTSFYEAKNEEKLLTLGNSDMSKTLKYSVYDFLQAKDHTPYALNTEGEQSVSGIAQYLISRYKFTNPIIAQNIQDAIAAQSTDVQKDLIDALYGTLNLIEALNRTITEQNKEANSEDQVNNKMYQVLNAKQGIIAFIESDGLHIAKINGFDAMSQPLENQKTSIFGDTVESKQTYINEIQSFKRLNSYAQNDTSGYYRYIYQDYNQMIGKPGYSTDAFYSDLVLPQQVDKLKAYGVNYQDLNTSVSNLYEKFLVNNSILSAGAKNEENPPFYKFDLFKEVNDSISNNQDKDNSLSNNNSWLWDYCGTILNKDNDQLLETFFGFKQNEASQTFKDWLRKKLKQSQNHTSQGGRALFKQGWADWNKEIDKFRNKETDNKTAPLVKLSWGGEAKTHITNVFQLESFKPFATSSNFALTNWVKWSNEWQTSHQSIVLTASSIERQSNYSSRKVTK